MEILSIPEVHRNVLILYEKQRTRSKSGIPQNLARDAKFMG